MDSANLQSDGKALERMLTVQNQMGIHARPAAMIVRVTNKYTSEVFFEKDEEQVNGKSIMGLMMLAAGKGSQIKTIASGPDAVQCLDALEELFATKFDEK
ncbi:HPr family phosphocarrier protein [Pelagicoccus sp. SDUM812002]|uniref:HPr family phosphocarrier protein n=1 Tax=Pelagicoccus sp. SDUM812002 TaxID=3041266 RepID=UPI00280DC7EA|nr:HPr family phosphocarrier protein [Pelagicoccus sp. SDUM812002]MDQ8185691.1 HPr family phosphocarrier protein [Pelagicoccus sp. SDUM812002]